MLVILWEFQVRPGAEAAFERAYGPAGDWARLFAAAQGWLGTELLRDASELGRYATVDRWESAARYAAFRAARAEAYDAIDRRCESLTSGERLLGRFERVGHPSPA